MRYLNPRQDKTTSSFRNGTTRILEFFSGSKVMMSYRFFKMAAIESEIYFRVRFYWWHSFGNNDMAAIQSEIYVWVQVSWWHSF